MQGVEISHVNAAIAAGLKAYYDFLNSTGEEALRPIVAYGKKDTLGMDAGPEITIYDALVHYDSGAVVLTEERGSDGVTFNHPFRPDAPHTFRTVFICDPTDRSNDLKRFLEDFPKEEKIGDILSREDTVAKWEERFSGPATITGATSAISCIRRGAPIFAVIVNYITKELVVSCAAGNRILKLPSDRPDMVDLTYMRTHGKLLSFPGVNGDTKGMRRFATFLGDTGKIGYRENFVESGLLSSDEVERFLHYGKPGGPSRALYLSAVQPRETPMGFILSNGEKISEWIHWLSFVRFARSEYDDSQPALLAFEVFNDRPTVKEGILMSTPPNYSIFREHDGRMYIDTNALLEKSTPSKVRSMLLIAPFDNRWAVRTSSQNGYRPIVL
jgi:hypothetical protein